jgi:hypothetical protein
MSPILRACGIVLAVSAAVASSAFSTAPAAAQSSVISSLHGEWLGNGTDRNSADEQATPVTCRASNQAAGGNIRIKLSCDGTAGREEIDATLRVNQGAVNGSVTRSSSDLPFAVSGSVSGRTTGRTTTFDVRALFKTRARITLAVLGQHFSLSVIDPQAGTTLMKVLFRRG